MCYPSDDFKKRKKKKKKKNKGKMDYNGLLVE